MGALFGAREHVIVVGGGIGGLGTALAFGRAGHRVTLLERDALPDPSDAEDAFAAERRGAPQVHQTHGFLARLAVVLRDRFPDVLDDLLAAGVTKLAPASDLGPVRPGDEDLALLLVRRTTLEWVLRRAVRAEPRIEVRTGVAVSGLVGAAGGGTGAGAGTSAGASAGERGGTAHDGPTPVPTVTGVRLGDGTTLDAGVVVATTGRRSSVPRWLDRLGAEVGETVRESGLMYLTRWYRLPAGHGATLDPRLGGDLGFVKYLAVPGDGDTLSVTLALRATDAELRATLSEPGNFDVACRTLPGPDRFFAGGPLEPLGPVLPMGGLINRLRRFLDAGGNPIVLGFHAVGDAHTCTNPLYGRGCSLALVQAVLLADAAAAHSGDPAARSAAYEAACAREVEPWFDMAVQMDAEGADLAEGEERPPGRQEGLAAVMVAAGTDPVIGRAMARLWNLLDTPADLMADPEVVSRIAAVMADPGAYPVPPRAGPTRSELLDSLSPLSA
jgi:2-polyprenyl-6-methoxyphenol hydroxylase-like FAD-dependent oxidoreductase